MGTLTGKDGVVVVPVLILGGFEGTVTGKVG